MKKKFKVLYLNQATEEYEELEEMSALVLPIERDNESAVAAIVHFLHHDKGINLKKKFYEEYPWLKAKVDAYAEFLQDVQKDSDFLSALRTAGVNNWEGYSYAMELLEEQPEE
jgi:hypothetical protein